MDFTLESIAAIFQAVDSLYPGVRSLIVLERIDSKSI